MTKDAFHVIHKRAKVTSRIPWKNLLLKRSSLFIYFRFDSRHRDLSHENCHQTQSPGIQNEITQRVRIPDSHSILGPTSNYHFRSLPERWWTAWSSRYRTRSKSGRKLPTISIRSTLKVSTTRSYWIIAQNETKSWFFPCWISWIYVRSPRLPPFCPICHIHQENKPFSFSDRVF